MKIPSSKKQSKPQTSGRGVSGSMNAVQLKKNSDQIEQIRSILSARKKAVINSPGDSYEREADAVADHVAAGRPVPLISRLPDSIPTDRKPIEKLEEEVQRQPAEEKEELVQPQLIQRQIEEEEEEPVQPQLIQRHPAQEEEAFVLAKQAGPSRSQIADLAIESKESGRPLPPDVRTQLESGMGVDLSSVRVHDDARAHQATKALNARAFTHNNDIWLGSGESQFDTRLMAHEATHVVQQQSGLVQRAVQRTNGTSAAAAQEAETAEAVIDPRELPLETGRLNPDTNTITFSEIDIPRFKMAAHRGALYTSRNLKRKRDYDRGTPRQRDKWKNGVNTATIRSILENKIKRAHRVETVDSTQSYVFEVPIRGSGTRPYVFGNLDTVSRELTTPMWGGAPLTRPPLRFFHVDHIVELQLANWNNETWANELSNMELLEGDINEQSGRDIRNNIIEKVNRFNGATNNRYGAGAADIKANYDLEFQRPVARGGTANATRTQYWRRSEIEAGDHLNAVQARDPSVLGGKGVVRVFSTTTGGLGKSFRWPGTLSARERNWLKPFVITEKSFNTLGEGVEHTEPFGTFSVNIPADDPHWRTFEADQTVPIGRITGARYAGAVSKQSVLSHLRSLRHKKASPIRVDDFDLLTDQGIVLSGRIMPEISLLGTNGIGFELRNGGLRLYKAFVGEELNVPAPFSIRQSSLTLFADTAAGLGVSGRVDFGIDRVGEGFLGGTVNAADGLGFEGGFDFDARLFDPARVDVRYQDGKVIGSGEIGIPEGKVPGIRSADMSIDIDENSVSGTGTVEPAIRAIQQGAVTFSHSPEAGVEIGGSLELSDDLPNVSGGSIEARIRKRPEGEAYELSANGEIQTSMAGINATLRADYANGRFTVAGEGNYERGMLSGSLLIGVTNRAVGEDAELGEEPTDRITAYGGGTVTVQIAPWLQGTVGVRLLPNGEIELSGTIGLPDVLEIFPEKRLDRNIFSINLDIPIIGFAVAGQRVGIFASIGGGLDLGAGIGPGQLQELGLGITYNPDHEDQTHVTGGAKLVIPAHAGLRLYIRGSLGAGIPIVSAELGLEVGGQLGLDGAVEAGVQVDWTPARGLVLDAEAEIYAQPKFRFDLTGFADVTADLFITEITLYEKRWELAAFETGPDLRFGVRFPIHYEEGRPFDISWNDVQFQVPEVNTRELLGDLVDRII
jgi:hypothetical protein